MELWTFWNRPFLESICVRYINCHVSWGCTEDVFRCKSDRKSRLFGPGNWRFGSGAPLLLSTATQCLKITKKSHSTLQAKRATFTFWVDNSSLKNAKNGQWDILGRFHLLHLLWNNWYYSCYIYSSIGMSNVLLSSQERSSLPPWFVALHQFHY